MLLTFKLPGNIEPGDMAVIVVMNPKEGSTKVRVASASEGMTAWVSLNVIMHAIIALSLGMDDSAPDSLKNPEEIMNYVTSSIGKGIMGSSVIDGLDNINDN